MRDIHSLSDLSEVVTAVANRVLEVATHNTSTGQYYVGYDHVSDLISKADFDKYFDFIADELLSREEVLDMNTDDHEFDINCALNWCKNYEPYPGEEYLIYGTEELLPAPSMARLAEIGQNVVNHIVREGYAADININNFNDFGIEDDIILHANHSIFPEEFNPPKDIVPLFEKPPLLSNAYEELLCDVAESKSFGLSFSKEYELCINAFNQNVAVPEVQEKYPQEIKLLETVCSEKPGSRALRTGAIMSGQPVVMLSYSFNGEALKHKGVTDRNILHAQTRMMTEQLRAALAPYKASICDSFNSVWEGPDMVADEIHAIIPAAAPRENRLAFEKDFETSINGLALSQDFAWFKNQYDILSGAITEVIKKATLQGIPDVRNVVEKDVLIEACAVLGNHIGKSQADFDRAYHEKDQATLENLASECDLATNKTLLDNCLSTGFLFEHRKGKAMVSLYHSSQNEPTELIVKLPKSEVRAILNEMGYEKDLPISTFLSSYSIEAAKEIKELYDARQQNKPSLSSILFHAEQKRSQAEPSQTARDKGYDRE